MGNSQSCGIGVLNNSNLEINVGMSMVATHYFENGIKKREIFYKWPGAVTYTVFAFARSKKPNEEAGTNDLTKERVIKEVIIVSGVLGGGIAVGAVVTAVTAGVAAGPVAAAIGLAEVGAVGGTIIAASAIGAGTVAGTTSGLVGAYTSQAAATEAFNAAVRRSALYCRERGCYAGGSGTWLIVEGGPYMEDGHWKNCDLTIREITQSEVFNIGNFTAESHERYHTQPHLPCTLNCDICRVRRIQ